MWDSFLQAVIWTSVVTGFSALIGAVSISFKLWMDNRSTRKALRAIFVKVRNLETKVFGTITSELDVGREE